MEVTDISRGNHRA